MLAFVILSYTAFEMKDFARGPQIVIDYPANGATVNAGLISIKGTADHVSSIQVNGGDLFTDTLGHFKKDILLSPGYNVIEVRARDKFGRQIERKLELVAEANSPHAPVAGLPTSIRSY
jgi:hypothetical protein